MGSPGNNDPSASYSAPVGFIYVFNIIVGTGALTLPKAFAEAGWVLSSVVLIMLGFVSYITVSFMIETMSTGNAIRVLNRNEDRDNVSLDISAGESDEQTPLLINSVSSETNRSRSIFEITEQLEMAHLAQMVFNKGGVILFYISICIYLFGDLTIYAAAAPKSVRDVICTYVPPHNDSFLNVTLNSDSTFDDDETLIPISNTTIMDNDQCWETVNLSRMNAYRICVAGFFVLLGPFVFFNVSKTKYIQILTSFLRWFSFGIMFILTAIRLYKGEGRGHPPQIDFNGVPNLFGISIYSFMCHHSLPALITPLKRKSSITPIFIVNYVVILLFYLLLSFTEIFSFDQLMDLCTLNFQPNHKDPITNVKFFQYFLSLFPAFTLSTNFPILAITLRNTLRHLFLPVLRRLPRFVGRYIFPILVLIPPLAISMSTSNVTMLVGVTGSYAGVAIQYLIPAFLVFYARRTIRGYLPQDIEYDERFKQKHRSMFYHWIWPTMVVVWSVFVYVIVSYYYLMRF